MAKNKNKKKKQEIKAPVQEPVVALTRKLYDKELAKLHVELVKLQEWVVHQG